MTHLKHTKLAIALALGLASGYASAAGFQLLEQNASGLGNAYAGSAAVVDNASTIFFNPAGMTQLKEREFSAGLSLISPSFKFSNSGSNVGFLAGTGNGSDAGSLAAVPNAYLSWALNKDLYVGVGLSAPFGLKTDYGNSWVGAAQARSFSVETLNLNPSIAYRVNDAVSVGGGVSYQHLDAKYKRTAAVVSANAVASEVTASLASDAWGWNVGGLFTVSPATKVGVSYRSTVSHEATGSIVVTGPASAGPGVTSGTKASLKLPDTAVLSATHELNNQWQLLGDVSWTGWSSIPKLDLVRTSGVLNGATAQTLDTDFRDTYRVAVGANYQYRPDLKLKFGLAFDQTPVKGESTRLVSLPDADRTQISTGAQWALAGGSTLDVGVAYLMFADSNINNNQFATGRGIVKGSYTGNVVLLGVQYSMPF
jgi:long-chain fatty acid transport protein